MIFIISKFDMQARTASEVNPTKLEVKSIEEYKQEGAPLHLYSLTQAGFSKREKQQRTKKGEVVVVQSFTLSWSSSILRKFCGVFSLVVSPRKIFFLLCSYVFVHVVILVIFQCLIFLRYHLSNLRKFNISLCKKLRVTSTTSLY